MLACLLSVCYLSTTVNSAKFNKTQRNLIELVSKHLEGEVGVFLYWLKAYGNPKDVWAAAAICKKHFFGNWIENNLWNCFWYHMELLSSRWKLFPSKFNTNKLIRHVLQVISNIMHFALSNGLLGCQMQANRSPPLTGRNLSASWMIFHICTEVLSTEVRYWICSWHIGTIPERRKKECKPEHFTYWISACLNARPGCIA